jgi:hypothetical protein
VVKGSVERVVKTKHILPNELKKPGDTNPLENE